MMFFLKKCEEPTTCVKGAKGGRGRPGPIGERGDRGPRVIGSSS